jgi:CRISPR-associated endonuclease/helicase Cas3
MNEKTLTLLWGKTVKDKPEQYHPVLFHLLDVGHCAALLWDECLPQIGKAKIAEALGLDESRARRAVIYLAAWHDIGKVAPGFQFQNSDPRFGPKWLWQRLREAGLDSVPNARSFKHAQMSAGVLVDSLQVNAVDWRVPNCQTALILAHIAGAHHGTFPHSGQIPDAKDDALGDDVWHGARIEMMQLTARLLCPEAPLETLQSGAWKDKEGGAVGWLAGLISVADWLGSSEFFPAAGRRDEDLISAREYSGLSLDRAKDALTQFGWLPKFHANQTPLDFQATFNFAPNALQRAILKCTQDLNAPFFAIAEAPMGVGKTEAAFVGIDAALEKQFAAGFYIALPTQATSNAMHDRARDDYLLKRQGHNEQLNLQLAHSGAILKDDEKENEEEVEIQPASVDADENPIEATVAAQSWFTLRKRPLLAPFGAGTIDQTLMGVLQTKHWFVRVFGLANKVVVFDEVHAYDAYMSTLLERLLMWLRANGCSVILLSATLPSSRRKKLLEAWGASVPEAEVKYPRLTWCDEKGSQSLSIEEKDDRAKSKIITLDCKPCDASTLAAVLREKLKGGGCAAIICNTVKAAQELYRKLKNALGEGFCGKENWHLFHARMPFAWRQERERKILKAFGKDKSHRPYRAIAVSTQVMEQSLDLDFDWMASELAPIDLLLQRAGRLHRHEYSVRPASLRQPELLILCDDGENSALPQLTVPDELYSHFILLRTWLALRGKQVLRLPDEIEGLIENVYETDSTAPDETWERALQDAREKLEATRKNAEGKARNVLIRAPKDALSIANAPSRELREDDDPETHETMRAATRDGDPSLQVVCLIKESASLYLPQLNGCADRSHTIDLKCNPNRAQTRALLRNALPLSNKALYFALRDSEEYAPAGWRENAHLRFARVIVFEQGQSQIVGRTLRLDGDLGLVIEKDNAGDSG